MMEHTQYEPLEKHLKGFFGYNEFRHSQKEIVTALLSGKDTVAILPTGAGKSICYQLPALLLDGVTIVVSPLISLMQDQVVSLAKNDLPAAFLNSSLRPQEMFSVMENIQSYKLLYVAPERLFEPNFTECIKKAKISLFAIDEAHCISQWGHSFRKEYRQLSMLKKQFPTVPIIALTATATKNVESDIVKQLELKDPYVVRASFDRPNLSLSICEKTSPLSQLSQFLEKNRGKSGIIYAATRKTVDNTFEYLQAQGNNVGKYHAGMTDSERMKAQHDFVHGEKELVVATVAFGMGINKPDVRFIVHMDMPNSIEQYYQEIGRAGRDGLPAECVMFYSSQELILYKFFLEKVEDPIEQRASKERTNKMYSFCCSSGCRRRELLNYFQEKYPLSNCSGCDNCLNDTDLVDETISAQKILSCVYRLQQRFGAKHVTDVLRGSQAKAVLEKNHDQLSTYGLMREQEEHEVRYLIEGLIEKGYLSRSEGEYPVLQWTDLSSKITSGLEKFMIRKKRTVKATARKTIEINYDKELFNELSQLRRKLAQEGNVPAFVIFGDSTLIEMSTHYPRTSEAFMRLNGVGPIKGEKFGAAFLEIIANYCEKKKIQPPSIKVSFPLQNPTTPTGINRVDSARQTLILFREGLKPAEIAQRRNLAVSTVLDHLSLQIVQGYEVDISSLVSKERQELINKAIAIAGHEKLTPVKGILPPDFTYEEIRLVASFHKRN